MGRGEKVFQGIKKDEEIWKGASEIMWFGESMSLKKYGEKVRVEKIFSKNCAKKDKRKMPVISRNSI